MEKGLVSIIMPSYNTGRFIRESIDSVRNQTYKNWELIIVDDCSTDDTEKLVMSFSDPRILFLKNPVNSGAAVSRNYALREAKGEWIAFLDSDDIWAPQKLEKQILFMKTNNYFFSATACDEIDEDDRLLGRITYRPKHITKLGMYLYCWVGCLTVMYHAPTVGLVQIANLSKNNDYALWLKVIKKVDCFCLNENLASYRVRTGSISHDKFIKLVKSHYLLFRQGEGFGIILSAILTCINLVCGFYKRVRYVKKEEKI